MDEKSHCNPVAGTDIRETANDYKDVQNWEPMKQENIEQNKTDFSENCDDLDVDNEEETKAVKMNEDLIKSEDILDASIETIHVNETTREIELNDPKVETIILDENVNVEVNKASAQAAEETSTLSETAENLESNDVLEEVTTNQKPVWTSRVNENVLNKDNFVFNSKSAHSVALKAVPTQNEPSIPHNNFYEDVVFNDNSAHVGKLRVIPLLDLTEKYPNQQSHDSTHTSCSEKASQKRKDVDEVVFNQNSKHLSTIRVIPLHDLTGELETHKSIDAENCTKKRTGLIKDSTLIECTPAKRARVESTLASDEETDEVQLNSSSEKAQFSDGQLTSDDCVMLSPEETSDIKEDLSSPTPFEDLTGDSDCETVQISEPATLSPNDIKEFYIWAEKHLNAEKKTILVTATVAKRHNKGVLRLGKLPNSYNFQNVRNLVIKHTKHSGLEISNKIAFIHIDKSQHPPFCTAYIKWKNKDVLLALKAMELFRQAMVTLQGHIISCRYDLGLKVQWDANDRPIIMGKKAELKAKPPTIAPVQPFSNVDVITDSNSNFGLGKAFLKSLNITPPLNCHVTVKNLDIRVDEQQARNIFRAAGIIVTLRLDPDEDSSTVWIQYDHPLEAVQAISMFNMREYNNRVLKLTMDKSSLPKTPIHGFTKLGPGLGTNGAVLKGKGINNEIDNINKSALHEINKLKSIFRAYKIKMQNALKQQQEINSSLELQRITSTENAKNVHNITHVHKNPQYFVQSKYVKKLHTTPTLSTNNQTRWDMRTASNSTILQHHSTNNSNLPTRPNVQVTPNMQTAQYTPHMQTGMNMQVTPTLPIAQYDPNMQTPSNMQVATNMHTAENVTPTMEIAHYNPNMQTGLNMQVAPTMPTAQYNPNMQIRPNMQVAPIMPTAQYNPNMQVAPTMPTAQYNPNMQVAPTMPTAQYNPNMQVAPTMPTAQYNPNMHTGLNMQVAPTMPIAQYNPNLQTPQHNPTMQTELNMQVAPSMPTAQYNPNMQTRPNMQKYSYMQTTLFMENMPNAQPNLGTVHDPAQLNLQPVYPYIMPNQNPPIIPIQPLLNANISIPSTGQVQVNSTQEPAYTYKTSETYKTTSQDQNTQNRSQIDTGPMKYNLSNKLDIPPVRNSPNPEGERSRDRSREREAEKQKEIERQKDADRKKEEQREVERQKEAERAKEKRKELDRKREIERQREEDRAKEKQKEIERRKDADRKKEEQREVERQKEAERAKEKRKELDRKREIERQREEDRAKEKQREIERQRDTDKAKDKYRELDRHREDSGRPATVSFRYLPSSVTSDDLRVKMREIGKVISAQVLGKGLALVIFKNREDAEECIHMYNKSKVDGQTIEVKWK